MIIIKKENKQKINTIVGSIGAFLGVFVFISYIPQISGNIHGHKGDFIQPFVAGINCTLWVLYGLLGEKRDWPIVIANSPGIIFGFTAAFTAL